MEVYLLKASAILALFLIVYQIFLKNETFFTLNRFFLLGGLLSALLLPFVTFQDEVLIQATAMEAAPAVNGIVVPDAAPYDWRRLVLWAYLPGILICTGLVFRQLHGLFSIIRKGTKRTHDGYILIPSTYIEGPFSFFRYIFYNPQVHDQAELALVLEHEKAHGKQLHSVDILLARVTAIVLWINPMVWWYQKIIQQNLEYLADARAVRDLSSVREYQYALLKVSGNPTSPPLVSHFNQSLIKKRIVMLQRNQSKSIHVLKYLLILPMLALFLMAFNRETVYVVDGPNSVVFEATADQTIELLIDKDTKDEQLLKMKKDLVKDKIDFSYTTVRNEAGEIIDISLNINGTASNGNSFSGTYNSDSEDPIKPLMVLITPGGGISIGEVSAVKEMSNGTEMHFTSDSGKKSIWVHRTGNDDTETIEIREVDGKDVFIVNGEEVTTEEMEQAYLQHLEKREAHMIKVAKGNEDVKTVEIREVNGKEVIIVDGKEVRESELHQDGAHKNVFVKVMDGDESTEADVRIRTIDLDEDADENTVIWFSDEGSSSKYEKVIIDTEKSGDFDSDIKFISTDGKKPLIYIDGKKANEKAMKALSPDQIESINVIKGEKAIEKHGKKARNGVVEIITKKG